MNKHFFKKIHIETILGCNSKCIFCPNNYDPFSSKVRKMSGVLFKKIVDEITKIPQVRSVKLSLNGEPLLDKNIASKIQYIKNKKNLRISINTNAYLLDEKISKKIINSGLDKINFHVSGFTSSHEEVMIGLSFKKVIDNILKFQKMAHESGSDIKMAIKYVCVRKNQSDLKKAQMFWTQKGFLFRPDILDNRINSLKDYRDLKVIGGKKKKYPLCPLIFEHIFIRYNGDVVSCWSDWYSKRVFGNCEKRSLLEIFNCRQFEKLRAEHLIDRQKSLSICHDCSWEDKDAK